MQVTFVNGSDTWFTYYGLDPATGTPLHGDLSGNAVPSVPTDTPTDAISFAIPAEGFSLPMLSAARLYISKGAPLLFKVDANGNPLPPQPADATDPNYQTPWDFFEVTYIPIGQDGLFNFNLSNVQSANLPLGFRVQGTEPSNKSPVDYTRGWKDGGYTKFLESLQKLPDFKNLILPGSLRVLAPGTAITAYKQKVIPVSLFDEDYLKSYVDLVWKKFAALEFEFIGDPPVGSNTFVTWKGWVTGSQQLLLVTTDLPGLEPIVLDPPSTSDLFENNALFFASGYGEDGSVQRNYANQLFGTLCAAFNRSMMLTTGIFANSSTCAWCKAVSSFYQNPITNHYSKEVHANCVHGMAYAFQSDDHCDVSSFISVLNPTKVILTLEG